MHFVTALCIVTLQCDNSVHCVIALHQRHSELVCLSVECAFLPVNRHFLQQFARKTTKFTALDKGNKINSPRQKLDTWRLICTRQPGNCTRIGNKSDLLQIQIQIQMQMQMQMQMQYKYNNGWQSHLMWSFTIFRAGQNLASQSHFQVFWVYCHLH